MSYNKHIINKQIIEIQLPKNGNTFEVQQKLSTLCNEQFTPIIDTLLCDRYGRDQKKRYQIDQLIIDLGNVHIEDMTSIFAEKLNEALIAVEDSVYVRDIKEEKELTTKTPLQMVSYYLKTGRLPWWSDKMTKAYLLEQLDTLIKRLDRTFEIFLNQLPSDHVGLDRFLYTFREEQILFCLQALTTIPVKGLCTVKKELERKIQKNTRITKLKIGSIFWKAAFNHIHKTQDYQNLKERCAYQTLLELGVDLKKEGTGGQNIFLIRSLVEKYKTQYPSDTIWQQFFQYVSKVVNSAFFYQLDMNLLEELRQLLSNLQTSSDKDLQPIARHLQILQVACKSLPSDVQLAAKEGLETVFEDSDFITVQNAGLVLLWPFLQRFFENLGVMEHKVFINEIARNKAVCALQYLCDAADTELFEGMLPFVKVLCGVPLEDTVLPIALSSSEKEIAEGLLRAIITRGPHWENLSLAGFRTSYLCRQASLRTRDDYWLLQVKKETYDITLEKLPWSFTVVKLPWMQAVLMVEWI